MSPLDERYCTGAGYGCLRSKNKFSSPFGFWRHLFPLGKLVSGDSRRGRHDPTLVHGGRALPVRRHAPLCLGPSKIRERPSWQHWRSAAILGSLLLLCGNGAVSFSEQFLPSGIVALIVATIPLWMVVIEWLRGDTRPNLPVVLGLVLGLGGIALFGPEGRRRRSRPGSISSASLSCYPRRSRARAAGSYYSRHANLPASPCSRPRCRWWRAASGCRWRACSQVRPRPWEVDRVTPASVVGLLYLIVFGSMIGFSAYIWLLRVTRPSLVSTYAFVNPVVAVLLGWTFVGEPLNPQIIAAAAIIVAGIGVIVFFQPAARQEIRQENTEQRTQSPEHRTQTVEP